jgi:type II secretory ATPase GspE/PulE/Tfp pilus assembly ATPase PilB-like protein
MFTNPDTNERDLSQQRAFEVIVGMFVMTFHDEAERNEGRHSVGTQTPRNRAGYNKLKKKLKKLTGMSNQKQLIMFMTGAGGSGKTRVINTVWHMLKDFARRSTICLTRG